jgi:hypothetical protein
VARRTIKADINVGPSVRPEMSNTGTFTVVLSAVEHPEVTSGHSKKHNVVLAPLCLFTCIGFNFCLWCRSLYLLLKHGGVSAACS